MNKISKILATSLLCFYSSTSFADLNSQKIEELEAKIAKMEKESSINQKYEETNKQITDFLKKTNIFGRLQFDKTFVTNNEGSQPLYDNLKLRAGRIGIGGDLGQGWGYKYEMDFANNKTRVTDAYLQKSLYNEKSKIKIGQFKEPFSLEELTSSRFTTFLERSSINGLAPDRNIGVQYSRHSDYTNLFVGVFGDNVGSDSQDGDESKSATSRFVLFHQFKDKDAVHLGAAYRISKPTANQISYSFKPEASIENSDSAITTSDILNINRINQIGLELAAVAGPVSIQSEYIRSDISGNKSYYLDGYYVQLSTFLTKGDKRNYNTKTSAFDRVKPKCTKKGAWEVAYRFSQTDANHSGLAKGAMNNNTIGLNYYANNNVRFLFNYINVNVDKNSVYGDDSQIASIRAQIDF